MRPRSPLPQGLEAAHAAQHQLGVVLVGVHLLIVGHERVLPLVQFLVPGSLDLLPSEKTEDCCGHGEQGVFCDPQTAFPKALDASPIPVCPGFG